MGDKTGIEWTDATWNPVTGCTKVSQGCKNCYAKHQAWPRLKASPATVYFGREFEDLESHPERLQQPLSWTKPRRIFVNSMSDLFHELLPFDFTDQVFAVMAEAPWHTFQVLTKRPDRMREYLAGEHRRKYIQRLGAELHEAGRIRLRDDGWDGAWPLPNVWLGVSVEDQETADSRIPILLHTPAAVRWISAEPLLGPIDARKWLPGTRIADFNVPPTLDWVVVGGESGKGARPMSANWVRDLRDECRDADVPFLFKQWGEWREIEDGQACRVCGCTWNFACPGGCSWIEADLCSACEGLPTPAEPPGKYRRLGKRNAGRELDGRTWDEYPR